jgi:hypothetical protein
MNATVTTSIRVALSVWSAVTMQCPVRILACTSIVLLAFALPADAQDATAPARHNAAYFEFLGNGGVFSINYERAVTPSLRLRVGVASWTAQSFWSDAETQFETFPLMLHVIPGRGAHRFEAAIGVLPGHRGRQRDVGESGGFVSLTGLIGYRYEPPGRRFVFRSGVTPFYGFGDSATAYPDEGFLPSVGFSFGARF